MTDHEQSRLGIIHLLVWMACVAFYLGVFKGLLAAIPYLAGRPTITMIPLYLQGMGSGTALAGLLLYFARSCRRVPFPTYPGEYLLVALGCAAVLNLAFYWALGRAYRHEADTGDFPLFWWKACYCALLAAKMVVFVAAGVKVKVERWRLLLLFAPFPIFAGRLNSYVGTGLDPQAFPLLLDGVLVVVLVMDLVQRRRYPWTHWLGAGVQLWFGVCIVVQVVLQWLAIPVR